VLKRNVCVIGPLPPPMNGNSKAIDTILKSELCNDIFSFFPVNLSREITKKDGGISFAKIKVVLRALETLKYIKCNHAIDTYYLTIAQSSVGCLRDVALLRQIYKNHKNAKVILHLHGGGFREFYNKANPVLKLLIKKYYSKAVKIIVLSNSLKKMFNGIVSEDKIQVIENCVDNEFMLSDDLINKKLHQIENGKPLKIVYLSNMIKTKGYFDVLNSAQILNGKNISCEVLFAGKFSNKGQEEEFFDFIKENNLSDKVMYLGVVDGETKKQLLFEGDVFILPTYYPPEGQPISILEAMSAGMPIITTRHGAIPDVIIEGLNGIFIPFQSPASIAKAITDLVNDTKKISYMGKNNRRAIMEKHLEINYINNMINILSN